MQNYFTARNGQPTTNSTYINQRVMHSALQDAISGPGHRDRRPPFRPSSVVVGGRGGDRIEEMLLREKQAAEAEARRSEFAMKYAMHAQKSVLVADAETGESIEISKAVWSPTEGRLSNGELDYILYIRFVKH